MLIEMRIDSDNKFENIPEEERGKFQCFHTKDKLYKIVVSHAYMKNAANTQIGRIISISYMGKLQVGTPPAQVCKGILEELQARNPMAYQLEPNPRAATFAEILEDERSYEFVTCPYCKLDMDRKVVSKCTRCQTNLMSDNVKLEADGIRFESKATLTEIK